MKEAGVCISWKEGERGNVLSRVALFMDVRLRVSRLCIKNPRRVERRDESGGSFFFCLDAVLGLGAAVLLHL